MFHSILVGFDGSEAAKKAFDYALDLAVHYQAALNVVSVARPPEPASDVEAEALLESAQEHYAADFSALTAKAQFHKIMLQSLVRFGHPAEQILYQADTIQADLIVVGHRGSSFLERWHIGSVSKQVMTYSKCPVLIVR